MIDLEDRFRPIVDDCRGAREPIGTIAARAQEYRRRDRARTRTRQFGAGILAVALVVALVGIVNARREPSHTASPIATSAPLASATTTTTLAVPAGWKTYDYGLARLSIPPSWTVTELCPAARTLLLVNPSIDGVGCGAGNGGPTVTIGPLPLQHPTAITPHRVNGIGYSLSSPDCPPQAHCGAVVSVPGLRVQLTFSDFYITPILRTLTRSTYARVRADPFGPTPASWKTVTYAGYTMRIPATWNVVDTGSFCGPERDTAYVGPGLVAGCPGYVAPLRPQNSAGIERIPLTRPTRGHGHNGLRFTRWSVHPPFVGSLVYTVTGGTRPVAVAVGMGLDAAIARGILGSIRATHS